MEKQRIADYLTEFPENEVVKFATYCNKLFQDVKTKYYIEKYSSEQLANLFKQVKMEWLVFDWVHITLQSTGVSFDYVALKNKMLITYPESIIDVQLVFDGDTISFWKESGKVTYNHTIANPFTRKDQDVIWAYAVVKNRRWEFLTTLSKEDLDKHRKTAKTDFIWKQWFQEMCLKTIMKKACKLHFSDIFQAIEEQDNENYSLDNPLDLDLKLKQEIDNLKTMEELQTYYNMNKGKGKDFDKYISLKKSTLWKSTK